LAVSYWLLAVDQILKAKIKRLKGFKKLIAKIRQPIATYIFENRPSYLSKGGGLMVCFGFLSTKLAPEAQWRQWVNWLPERFRYFSGPVPAGKVRGVLPQQNEVQGWAWNAPENSDLVWNRHQLARWWQRLWVEVYAKQIKIIGIDSDLPLPPPIKLGNRPYFPGISDGKALELLLFVERFRGILRSYEISAQRAKALIVWEEGNLGITCARLIASEVRFLTLVHPNLKLLERAADLIMAESGISPQITETLPPDFKGAKIVIKCGKVTAFPLQRDSRRLIWCEIFQKYPQLSLFNLDLPLSVWHKSQKIPLYPVLGEVILRAGYNYDSEFWYGAQLPLERVIKLARIFNELGIKITI
jgi:hypothetical protein